MRKKGTTFSISSLIIVIIMIFELMPIVKGFVSAYPEILFLAIGYYLMIRRIRIIKKHLLYILSTCIFLVFVAFIRRDPFFEALFSILVSFFVIMSPVLILDGLPTEKCFSIFKCLMLVCFITELTSIIGLTIYPLAARESINIGFNNQIYSKMNIGGYTLAYMLPVLTICMYVVKEKRVISCLQFYIFVSVSMVFVVLTKFMIAIILFSISLVVIIVAKGNIKRAFALGLFCSMICILVAPMVSQLFLLVSDKVSSYDLRVRLIELSRFFNGKLGANSDLYGRFNRMSISLNSFKMHPILGGYIYGTPIGGHNSILDYLGTNGSVGLIFLILFFTYFKRNTIDICKTKQIRLNTIMALLMFFLFAFLNPAFYSDVFLILSYSIFCTSKIMNFSVTET